MAVRYSCDCCGATLVSKEHAVALGAIEEIEELEEQPDGSIAKSWLLCRECYARFCAFLEHSGTVRARPPEP